MLNTQSFEKNCRLRVSNAIPSEESDNATSY